jgi:Zn-dependent peptidase ImmA (M78 family)
MPRRGPSPQPIPSIEEIEANYFAAHLLVPTSLLKAEMALRPRGLDLSGPDDTIAELAKKFDVSTNLMAFRLGEEGFFHFTATPTGF